MFIQAITLFPEMFRSITEFGVTGRACQQNIWRFNAINPRQFADNKLGYIDDRPFGGGVGMVMMAEPLYKAIDSAKQNLSGSLKTIYLSPQGAPLTHQKVVELSQVDNLILLCGRYEGVDERVLQSCIDEEISIGDFVVSGGELFWATWFLPSRIHLPMVYWTIHTIRAQQNFRVWLFPMC